MPSSRYSRGSDGRPPARGVTGAAGHFVYIARCADGTLYVGYARDVERRVAAHNAGRGAKYTAGRRPVAIVHVESFGTRGEALRREHALKRFTRAAKLALVACRARL